MSDSKEIETSENRYTEGVCNNGVAILCDGEMIAVTEILSRLNAGNRWERRWLGAIDMIKDMEAEENRLKEKIEHQWKEIEALRGFAQYAHIYHINKQSGHIEENLQMWALIDKNGNPTPLLTGVNADERKY